jgi:hypothetical protein
VDEEAGADSVRAFLEAGVSPVMVGVFCVKTNMDTPPLVNERKKLKIHYLHSGKATREGLFGNERTREGLFELVSVSAA